MPLFLAGISPELRIVQARNDFIRGRSDLRCSFLRRRQGDRQHAHQEGEPKTKLHSHFPGAGGSAGLLTLPWTNFEINPSTSIAGSVSWIQPPTGIISSEAPGATSTYFSPSNPWVRMEAMASFCRTMWGS